MQSLSDTTLTTSAFSPSGWYGGQFCGATSCGVAMFTLANTTQTSLSITSTHAGTAQYLVGGLAAGSYTVHCPSCGAGLALTTASGDGSVYFESSSGAISLSQSSGSPGGTYLGGTVKAAGNVIIHIR